ncbi:MAG: hypothetical protein ACLFUJ_09685 [Phycisphaerae bacterium]
MDSPESVGSSGRDEPPRLGTPPCFTKRSGISARTWTPLHAAVWKNEPAIAGMLIRAGADTEARTRDGRRAIDLAGPDSEIRRMLLEAGSPASPQ